MKTIIFAIITIVISTGAMLASLNAKHPFVGPLVAFTLVSLFIIHLNAKNRQCAKQRENERLFYNYINLLKNKRSTL